MKGIPDPPDPKTSSSTSSDIRRKTKDEQRALYRDEGDAMTGHVQQDVDGRDVLTLEDPLSKAHRLTKKIINKLHKLRRKTENAIAVHY